ncbi:hypothetical protein SAMN03159463_05315 [Mesorhizobium sp. NFR06]|uniref:hypothetical protein n=1 Tax=Mesorhizobium sp. NFR06 TaxID=1566290 RepID=UPI0008F0C108|nr:hypothetical protein [Mesorhizobium sp. NFR06]SFP98450.1 hypothetical protein SAMN03159463_05315 [Mesorhizobium sp. NFR06]
MPKSSIPVDGEALATAEEIQNAGRLSSRSMLVGAIGAIPPVGNAAAALPAPAAASPNDRSQAALAKLKAAAEALDPNIYDWTIKSTVDLPCGLMIGAFTITTKFEGDGWYRALHSGVHEEKVFVEHAPEHDRNGERWLRITSEYRGRKVSALTLESDFNASCGQRIS